MKKGKKLKRRVISVFLVLVLALTMFAAMPLTASAAAPNATINYVNETLENLAPLTIYYVATDATASVYYGNSVSHPDGTKPIQDILTKIFGETLYLSSTSDGDPSQIQTIFIPARPPTPAPGKNDATGAGKNDGSITNVSVDMEYKLSTATTWTPCTGVVINGLAPGTYNVRVAASQAAKRFKSLEATVTIETPAVVLTPVSIANIPLAAPVAGAAPQTTVDTTEYSGTVTWNPADSTFKADTQYRATITLTEKSGYTLDGKLPTFFKVAGAESAIYRSKLKTVDVSFPKLPFPAVNIAAIPGVTLPVTGAVPAKPSIDNAQYTGTVSWSGDPATFAAGTVYSATISIRAKAGYSLANVPANFFTVAGATSVTNAEGSGIITATFPVTSGGSGGSKAPQVSNFDYDLSDKIFTGKAQAVNVNPKAGAGKVTAIYYNGVTTVPVNAGSYTVTIAVEGNAEYSAAEGLPIGILIILPADMAKVKISVSDSEWTGKQVKPAKFMYNGMTFKINSNSVINSLGKNKDIGKGQVNLTGKGNFTGYNDFTFKIVPKKTAISKITAGSKQMKVSWKKVSAAQKISKYEVRYKVKGTSKWKTKSYIPGVSTAMITKLKKGKIYQVQVRSYKTVSKVKYYSSWSVIKTSAKIK